MLPASTGLPLYVDTDQANLVPLLEQMKSAKALWLRTGFDAVLLAVALVLLHDMDTLLLLGRAVEPKGWLKFAGGSHRNRKSISIRESVSRFKPRRTLRRSSGPARSGPYEHEQDEEGGEDVEFERTNAGFAGQSAKRSIEHWVRR